MISNSKSNFDQEQWLPQAEKLGKVARVKGREEEEGRLENPIGLCLMYMYYLFKNGKYEKR